MIGLLKEGKEQNTSASLSLASAFCLTASVDVSCREVRLPEVDWGRLQRSARIYSFLRRGDADGRGRRRHARARARTRCSEAAGDAHTNTREGKDRAREFLRSEGHSC